MADNHHFLPPTNQIFQQITHNNFQIPNLSHENQIPQPVLGFRHFYNNHHDQEQQQRRIWVDQQQLQISNSHYELQQQAAAAGARERIIHENHGVVTNNNNAVAVPSSLTLPSFPVNFTSMGMGGQNGYYGKVGGVLGEGEDMRGSEQFVMDSRNNNSNLTVVPPNCWRNQGGADSPIKLHQPQPPPPPAPAAAFGRPLFTELLNGNNKRSQEAEIKEEVHDQNQNKRFKPCSEEALLLIDDPARKILENNCRQVGGNVEAIYGGSSSIDKTNKMCQEPVQDQLTAISSGDEKEEGSRDVKNEEKEEEEMRYSSSQLESSMADFFNAFMNRLHHQESLHQRFLQTIERLDEERKEQEEAWRKQELARLSQQAIDRTHDQALASSREATIVSYLEKITGQSIIIPRKMPEPTTAETMNVNKRWPKIEVDALIRIRTSLEPKFHDPALKAFVWEEISKLMSSMGYRRSAQRCKEKWENINRYYKKAKENAKLHSPHKHKTCPYFQQLDQFYTSKSLINGSPSSSSSFSPMLIQGRNLLPFRNIEEIPEKDDRILNHQIEGNKDEDHEDDDEEEEEEGSDAD